MRKIFAVASALALTVSLAACGGKGNGGGSDSQGGGADNAATNLVALAQQVGTQTSQENSAHMVFTGGAAGEKVTGQGDIRVGGDNPAIKMDMDTSQGSMSMVLLDGVLYMKLPQELTQGKPWIKIDSSSDNPIAKALGSVTTQMQQNADPRKTLEQFKDSGEITATKSEELNGKQTTHYSITVNVQKLVDSQKDPTLKSAMQQAVKAGLKDFPVELWVDDQNLPVRMTVAMPTPNPTTGKTTEAKVQVDYSDWGKKVDITAPPADQVGELPS